MLNKPRIFAFKELLKSKNIPKDQIRIKHNKLIPSSNWYLSIWQSIWYLAKS